ncbi:prolipoprotein diacylglyceryl transferase [Chloroflexota bacterium]
MKIAFHLGPFTISPYGILITIGIITSLIVATIDAKRRGEAQEHLLSAALLVIPLGVIGARLYHVIDLWDFYYQNPASILGGAGLGLFGAVIGGAIGLIIYTKWKKLSTLRWMDIVAPGVILAQAIGRWGNYFNQELYGYPTDLPWAIYIDPTHRIPGYEGFSHFHPLFFYEFLLNFSGFILLMVLGRKLKHHLLDGDIFSLYIVWYGMGRYFLENLKPNVWTFAGVATAQWIAGIAVSVVVAAFIYRRCRLRNKA